MTIFLNIFLCDSFLEFERKVFATYTNDTMLYIAGNNAEEVITESTNLTQKLFVG